MQKLIQATLFVLFATNAIAQTAPTSSLITNIRLIDGTGTPARLASVRFAGNKIIAVGDLKANKGEAVVDGKGFVLAPGFIDSHSHIGGSLEKYPEALADLNQGVTTIVAGQDGYGSYVDSIKAGISRKPIAINIATYTGHTDLREKVMGKNQLNRPATEKEIASMQAILLSELKKVPWVYLLDLNMKAPTFQARTKY